jgi:hypothetical protein
MIRVMTTMAKLRVGDRIHVPGDDQPEEVVITPLRRDPGDSAQFVFETNLRNENNGDDNPLGPRWYTYLDSPVEVFFNTDEDAAQRILEALAPFEAETLLAVRNGLCAECGRVACGRHR